MLSSGTWSSSPVIDKSRSNLNDVSGKYIIPASGIKYYKANNVLEYNIQYDEMRIVDGKFVNDDVEFYVVVPDPTTGVVRSLYFTEFNKEMDAKNNFIPVNHNEFSINGRVYRIAQHI